MAEKMTRAQFDNYMKDVWTGETLLKQFEDEIELWKQISKPPADSFTFRGKKVEYPVLPSWGGGNGSAAEDGDLPTAGATPNELAYVTVPYHYNRKYITNQLLTTAMGGDSSAISSIDLLYEAQTNGFKKDMNWKAFNSSTGLRTLVNGAVNAGTSIVLDSVKGFYEGQALDFLAAADNSTEQATDVVVTDVNEDTKTITVDTAVTLTDNDYVYQAGEKDKSLNGLYDAYQTTGTYHGLARSGNSFWQGKVISSTASTPISDTLLTSMRTAAQKGAKPKFWLTSFEIKDMIWKNILRQQINLTNVVKIAGGMETFTYHGFPVVPDNDCTAGLIALIDPSMIVLIQGKEGINWMEDGGSRLLRVSGKDSYEVLLRYYANILVKKPRYMPVCTGILEA